MSLIIKGMDMPYGCANCSFVSEVTYDSKGWAKYFCKVAVDGVRGKSVTNEVISMYEGGSSATFPDWCPLEEAEPRKQGRWEWDNEHGEYYCTNCMHHKDTEQPMHFPKYCNCCGAIMDGKEREDGKIR